MAQRRRRTTSRSSNRSRSGYGRSTARRTTRARRAPARRSTRSGRSSRSAPRQQRIVIEFAGASPVREAVEGLGVQYKPAGPVRVKPKL